MARITNSSPKTCKRRPTLEKAQVAEQRDPRETPGSTTGYGCLITVALCQPAAVCSVIYEHGKFPPPPGGDPPTPSVCPRPSPTPPPLGIHPWAPDFEVGSPIRTWAPGGAGKVEAPISTCSTRLREKIGLLGCTWGVLMTKSIAISACVIMCW